MNEKLNLLLTQLSSVIFGKERECRLTVCALLAGGDLLVEDVPGVGKTTLALALAQSLDLSFGRIQFTPDTLPGDDVRRVNWKVSALQGRPMIRDTEPQSRDELVLLPDLRDALPAGEAAYLAEDSIREGSLAQAVADLSGEVRDLPDGGILFEDELPVLVCEDLQRVEIMDLYG